MPADVEQWRYRGKCSPCGRVIWCVDVRVVCACSLVACRSKISSDGTYHGNIAACTDQELINFISSDLGRAVTLEQV
jgi:hypothetical protein